MCYVVGGGIAGVNAAKAAASAGADVVLVDEGPTPIEPLAGVEILARASALGYFDGIVPVWQGDTLHEIRARRHFVFATGAIRAAARVTPATTCPGSCCPAARSTPEPSSATHREPRHPRRAGHDVGPGSRGRDRAEGRRGRNRRRSPTYADHAQPGRGECRSPGHPEVLHGHTIVEAKGGKQVSHAVLAQLAGRGSRPRADVRLRSDARSPAGSRRQPHCCSRPVRAALTTPRAAASRSTSCRRTSTPPARSPASRKLGDAVRPLRRARRGSAAAGAPAGEASDGKRARLEAQPGAQPGGGATTRCRRRQRQVLRVPVRGRDRQGHPPQRRGGLRLDRAVQAVHDRDDGSVPGQHVPAPRDPGDGRKGPGESLEQVGTTTAPPAVGVGADGRARAMAGRSSPPSAPRSTGATATSARTSSGRATGGGPTTTATRRARRWRSTGPRG